MASSPYCDDVPSEMETYGDFTFNKGLGNITIFSYSGKDANVVIPSKINGRPVKRLEHYFILNNNTMESLTLSEGIERISYSFIGHCDKLKVISLPSTVEFNSANSGMFAGAPGLVDTCEALETINLASGNPYLSVIDHVLYNKDMTILICYPPKNRSTVIHVPDGVQTIEANTFEHNHYVEEIVLPDSVQSIGYWAFNDCAALKK